LAPNAPIVKTSRYAYAETLARLRASISAAGSVVFATIDQAAAAQSVGLQLRPTTLVIFGNPKAGTPFMDAFPLAALALPLKLLVWEEADAVRIAHDRLSEALQGTGVPAGDPRTAALDRALELLSDSVT
jgi:uncharacterized protein (DUF302 family)